MSSTVLKKGGLGFRIWLIVLSLILFFSFGIQVKAEDRSIDELRDSVVRILCYGLDGGTYIGTGFAVGTKEPVRHIVTNFHVVEPNLEGVTVLLSKEDQIKATVVAYDMVKDIAVLELTQDLYKRPPMEIGDSAAVKASDDVYALGFPGDADLIDDTPSGDPEDVTITRGIISKISTQGGRGIFQVDVSINSGNSGGPLLNEHGQVIGINTFKVTSASGINGAVRIDELIPMLESRGIEYLTSNSDGTSANGSISLLWIFLIAAGALFILIFLLILVVFLVKKRRKTPYPVQKYPPSHVHYPDQRAKAVKPVLHGVSGYFAGQRVVLDQLELKIGRDPNQCQLVYPDGLDEISRKHCTIRFDEVNHTFLIEDSSSNGTYLLSGERIPSGKGMTLKSGDRFYISSRENIFEVRVERF